MMSLAPCHDCMERTVTCHTTCEKYKSWLESRKPSDERKCDQEYERYVAHKAYIFKRKREKIEQRKGQK